MEPNDPRNPLNMVRRIYRPGALHAMRNAHQSTAAAPSRYAMHSTDDTFHRTQCCRECHYDAGDYIAFKLDIDNEPIEQALMKQLDPGVTDKIAEFFFEQHFDIAEMRSNFGTGLTTKLPEVLQLFHEVRNTGLRLHYWP